MCNRPLISVKLLTEHEPAYPVWIKSCFPVDFCTVCSFIINIIFTCACCGYDNGALLNWQDCNSRQPLCTQPVVKEAGSSRQHDVEGPQIAHASTALCLTATAVMCHQVTSDL